VILQYLDALNPDAQLLPFTNNRAADSKGLSDLVWCAGALHPIAHRIFRPGSYAPEAPANLKATASAQLRSLLSRVEERLRDNPWWYGNQWSIVDVCLSWITKLA
jgi:glutathione S-transferase